MDDESDWDSEPDVSPAPPRMQPLMKKPNGNVRQQHEQVDSRESSQEDLGDGRRPRDSQRTCRRQDREQAPRGDGRAPVVSPRGGGHQPRPKERHGTDSQAEGRRHPEQRGQHQKAAERSNAEEQPPYNFRAETEGSQRSAARQKPRPPGRQQRAEYSVPPSQTDGPTPDSAGTDIALKPIGSPGVVRQNSAALDRGEKPVPLDGPLVPRSSGPDSPLVEGEGDGTAAMAVAVSSCQFSQPEISVLRSGDRNPSALQSRYGRLSHRSLMRMWSEVLWVASVPVLVVTTFFFALTRCVLETVVRPVALGPLQLLGDHLLKPAAVTLHDSLLLPAAALLANALAALALLGRPLGEALDALLRPLATLLASCRLVQVTYGQPAPPGHRLQAV
ncbi:actin cytoskeleton-regulatory complex protein pan1-like isoform X2 [Amphibalanus amphitrite]|uniref:actin cytoskeleton-regulatory complex protein pan1-like isoform X2 n=1 Tax=Amphibalanus amphitrite TaxID=1232801 RepID=UPI001C90711A|nr:actin cytoskeleton-regulatory complex protein pan1-like isoform X2 [Amphibalanus amphitrite]